MNLLKSFARSDWTRTLALMITTLFVVPLAVAQSNSDPLAFDVPEPGETITINLQERGLIDATEFIESVDFTVLVGSESQVALNAKTVGQYCVTISNPPPIDGPGINDFTDPTLQVATVGGVPTRPIFNGSKPSEGQQRAIVFRDDENVPGVASLDRCRALNKAPKASLQVPDGVPDTDFADGELVVLDASGSTDPDPEGVITNYRFFDDTHGIELFSGTNPKPQVRLPDGETTIILTITDNSINQTPYDQNPTPTLTKVANRGAGKRGAYGQRAFGSYEGYGYGDTGPTATATATVVVATRRDLILNQINDITRADTDGLAGEPIQVTATTNADGVVPVTFQFFLNPGSETDGTPLNSTGGTLNFNFPDGKSTLRVIASIPGEGGQFAQPQDVSITVTPPLLTVNVPDTNQADTDFSPGELITVTATTNAQPGTQPSFQFFLNPKGEGNGTPIPGNNGATLSFRFNDGTSVLRVVVTAGGQTAVDDATITVGVPQLRVTLQDNNNNQLQDINQQDTDSTPGELITVNASTNAPPGTQVSFQFFLNPNGESNGTLLPSNGATLSFRFNDGVSVLRVVASAGGQTAIDEATVTVGQPAPLRVMLQDKNNNPLQDINQLDTDSKTGELIAVSAATNAAPGAQVSFQFFLNPGGESNGTLLPSNGATLSFRFNDGVSVLRVVATVGGQTASDDATVTVTPPVSVFAEAGADQTLPDSDGRIGEIVKLDASASTTTMNATPTFEWFLNPSSDSNGQSLGKGMIINPRLPDGTSVVRLVATLGGQVSTDQLTVNIGTRKAVTLANLPNLTPNQRRTALALDDVCSRLLGLETGLLTGTISDGPSRPAAALTADQSDLTEKCRGIIFNNTVDNQVEAVTDITPEDFAVARTQALLFANTQYTSVLDRLIALRGGARGLSLAGLNIQVDGQSVPLAVLQEMFGKIFGSGASADATEEPGGLLSDRWGMWVRGNFSTGGRDKSLVSPSFDADQVGVVIGTDYRLSSNAVIGASLGYLDSSIDFNPISEGSLDTQSMALSLYGSLYAAKSFYLDALVNYAQADYDARRNISYNQGSGLVAIGLDAKGSTEGDTFSAGLSGGYDFLYKGFTISPNAGFFYVDTTIDRFAEKGAAGLNLLYDDQKFQSLTANLGVRLGATINLPWAVLVPGLRVDFVREFEDETDVFQVRFANDPNGMSSAPIVIQTDNPDTSYYRIALNLSAQFKFGFAGYVEYQRIQSFNQIDFSDLAFGFRMQRSF